MLAQWSQINPRWRLRPRASSRLHRLRAGLGLCRDEKTFISMKIILEFIFVSTVLRTKNSEVFVFIGFISAYDI